MRPKFLLALLLVVLAVVGAAFVLNQLLTGHPAPPPPARATATLTTSAPVAPSAAPIPAVSSLPVMPTPATTNAWTPEQRQAAIEAETDRLQQWSANDDPASLSHILADLTHSEKEIRQAAIEAAKQYGSRDAIPVLKDAAANTSDTKEQMDLLAAAEFLSLPPIADEAVQQPKTPEQIQAAEQKQAQRQKRLQR
jgi:hypothetical protein